VLGVEEASFYQAKVLQAARFLAARRNATVRPPAPAVIVAGVDEIAPGVWHWTARHPKIGIDVSSYYLAEPRVLLDPLLPPEGAERLDELGPPQVILLTNRHHWRDCSRLHEHYGCPVRAPRKGMHEFGADQPVEPYDDGEALAGGAVTAYEVGGISPDESALFAPGVSALAVADGVINYDRLRFVTDDLMDDPQGTKRALKRAYARLAEELEFDLLLTAHGPPLVDDARERLRAFAES
jgi:glyoxylase-like metal-dependent hydrolase (beta-lactamase superfamily II)